MSTFGRTDQAQKRNKRAAVCKRMARSFHIALTKAMTASRSSVMQQMCAAIDLLRQTSACEVTEVAFMT